MGKLLNIVFSASGPIVALFIVAVWVMRRPSSPRIRRFAFAVAVFYVVVGTSVIPYFASRLLTVGYHQLRAEDVPAGRTAIALLGGGDEFVQGWTESLTITSPNEAERVLEAARVFRLISPAWIISSGGEPEPQTLSEASATTMRDELTRLGVPRDRIVIESASRSTHENAVNVVALLKSRAIDHVVLVTSATHMRRSLGAFRAVGVNAIPAIAPGGDWPSRWYEWLPSTNGLESSGSIAHEVTGIPYYWLRGWWRP
jgi:uncharacterized SAM-binding protein YcdF (DUF218 family)